MAGLRSPLYRECGKRYVVSIERMVEGYRREDPPAVPQLAVPVAVAEDCFDQAFQGPTQQDCIANLLCLVAFYYLLRVGEYTQPRYTTRNGKRVKASRTVQFTVGNVGFYKNGKIISRNSALPLLLSCDAATLKITNKKNGVMGETIHHKTNNKKQCPVKALAYIVHHIYRNGGNDTNLLCSYKDKDADDWKAVPASLIVKKVRDSVRRLNLHKNGIHPEYVGSHSLRAGGAMALKLSGAEDTTIKKMGRWSSLTFLQYIHNQISHLANDLSTKMSQKVPFLNIAIVDPVE